MISGLFSVEFHANNQMYGQGIVSIKEGAVNGGDLSYSYQGRFVSANDKLNADIKVKHYRGERLSVMGPMSDYSLALSGTLIGDTFNVAGGIPNVPNLRISIRGKRIADLHN